MEGLDTGTVIAVCAVISVLFILIQISVWPLKENQARLEQRMDSIENKLDQLLARS